MALTTDKVDDILDDIRANDSSPGRDIVAVTASDTVADPAGPFRGLVFAVAGAIKLTMASGQDRVIPSGLLAINQIHALQFTRVWVTGTTATGIHGIV